MLAGCQWLTPVIQATQDAEISRIVIQSQPGDPILNTTITKKRTGEVAKGVGPEFKPQYPVFYYYNNKMFSFIVK
jgi:hypothetical protein